MSPSLRQFLVFAWVAGLALLWLFRFDAWLWPVQLFSAAAADLSPGPYLGETLWRALLDATVAAAILATALGLGATVVGGLIPHRDWLGLLLALALGLWLLAVAALVAGATVTAGLPWCLAAVGVWVLPAPRQFARDFQLATGRISGTAKLFLLGALVAALLNLPGALAPPFEYDELEYHLGALAEYNRAGRIVFLPHNFYSNLPQLTEMLYWIGCNTSGDGAAKLLHWMFSVLAALAVYATGLRLWNRNIGVVAAALFYCLPFVQDLSQTARIDLATTFFAVLAFGALLADDPNGVSRASLWLSALAAGMAVATKWTAVPVVLLPCVIVLVARRRSVPLAMGYLLLAILPVTPWLVKNWWLAGNPVYPLLTNLWPSPHWSAAQAALFAERHYPVFDWRGLWELVERPWHYSFAEARAVPWLLMAAPVVLLVGKMELTAALTGWLFVTGYVGWYLFTFRPWRFLFPVVPLVALLAGYGLARTGRSARVAVGVTVWVGLCGLALNNLVDGEQPERVPARISLAQHLAGQMSRSEFLARVGGGVLAPVLWMNEHLPPHAKVLYVGEARVALARHAVVWATAFDRHPLVGAENPVGELGVTHVYISFPELRRLQAGYSYLQELDWSAFRQFLQQHAREIFRSPVGVVYEVQR